MVDVAALRAGVGRHVLDQSQHLDIKLFEHRQALAGVDQGNVLGRRDDDRPGQRHVLAQRQCDVARARGQIDDQVVQLAPFDVDDQLFQCLHQQRPAPDHRLVDIDDETQGHDADPARGHDRPNPPVRRSLGGALGAGHHLLGRTVDVGVEQADGEILLGQGQRKVGADGRLADAALARCDRDDVLDAGDLLSPRGRRRGLDLLGRRRNRRQQDLDPDVDRINAVERVQGLGQFLFESVGRSGRTGGHRQVDRQGRAVEGDVADGAVVDEPGRRSRSGESVDRFEDFVFGSHDRPSFQTRSVILHLRHRGVFENRRTGVLIPGVGVVPP